MYGAIIGDLAGSIYEYDQLKEIKKIDVDEIITDNAFYSDDTILTIAILDAIETDKNYYEKLREYFLKYKDYKPDFKPYFKNAFSPNLIKWAESNKIGESCGNGALSRISPVGYMFDNIYLVDQNAYLATIPSHNSKEAIDSATIIAKVIFYLRKGYNLNKIYNMLNIKLNYRGFDKFNKTCSETIGNCLYTLYNSDSFNDAIIRTLRMGGDTDTNCSIVGSMAEAMFGIDKDLIEQVNTKLPKEFIKVLEKSRKYGSI